MIFFLVQIVNAFAVEAGNKAVNLRQNGMSWNNQGHYSTALHLAKPEVHGDNRDLNLDEHHLLR
jgi:hypothetical protein